MFTLWPCATQVGNHLHTPTAFRVPLFPRHIRRLSTPSFIHILLTFAHTGFRVLIGTIRAPVLSVPQLNAADMTDVSDILVGLEVRPFFSPFCCRLVSRGILVCDPSRKVAGVTLGKIESSGFLG